MDHHPLKNEYLRALIVLLAVGVVAGLTALAHALDDQVAYGPMAMPDHRFAAASLATPADDTVVQLPEHHVTAAPAVTSHDDPVADGPEATAAPTPSGDGFTLAQLADGQVSAADFNAFWDRLAARARSAPCVRVPANATVVTLDVGATPPSHLGDAYHDHAPRMAAARAARASECAG